MIRINLLPQSKIKKSEHPEVVALAQILLALIVLFFGAQYFFKTLKLNNIKNDLKIAKAEHSKYQAIINELNTIKAVTAELETKKNLINNLIAARTVYPIFMENLLEHLPKTMWVTGLQTQMAEDRTVSFSITATALDIYTIADLVKVTESSDVISKVELGAISQTGDPANPMYNFTFRAAHKALPPQK
ncbi:MAG: PilN domain-containing protein [Endomicrobiia bacterium]|nr:PilN domain-containing protein [Endomicrobiia bacterium]